MITESSFAACTLARVLLSFLSLFVPQMVFSSSCTVYGNPQYVPLDEGHPLKAVSPYGRTKLMIEDIFRDLYAAEPEWRIILLRYFNPVGAHPSGTLPPPRRHLSGLTHEVSDTSTGETYPACLIDTLKQCRERKLGSLQQVPVDRSLSMLSSLTCLCRFLMKPNPWGEAVPCAVRR